MSYLSTAIKKARYLLDRDDGQILVLEKNNGGFLNIALDTPASRDAAITTAVNNLLAGVPGALDTLNELATALGDDANFAATVTTALGTRLKWRGAWAATTAYAINDLVMFNGGLYLAPTSFTSGVSFVKANWTELAPQIGTYALPDVVVSKTANYTAHAGEFVLCDTTSAGFTVTLPASPTAGQVVGIKKTNSGANVVTISPNVDGGTITVTTQNHSLFVEYDGTAWRARSGHYPRSALMLANGQQAVDYGVAGTLAASGAMYEAVYETRGNVAPFVQCISGDNVYNSVQDDIFFFAGYNRSNGGTQKVAGVPAFGLHIEGHVFDNGDDRPGNTHAFEYNFDYVYAAGPPGLRMMAFRCDRNDPKIYTRWTFSIGDPGSIGNFRVQTYSGTIPLESTPNGDLNILRNVTAGGTIRSNMAGLGVSVAGSGTVQVDAPGDAGGRFRVESTYVGVGKPLWLGTDGSPTGDVAISRSAANTMAFSTGITTTFLGDNGNGSDVNAGGNTLRFNASQAIIARTSFVVGTAALATSATAGFLYIPTCAGSPSGTPAAQTGTVPIVFDTTNRRLYVYESAAWHYFGETA